MERKEFIKGCGFLCLGMGMVSLMESCGSTKIISGTITGSHLVFPETAFHIKGREYRKYLVVEHDMLQYPICVYRFGEEQYSALFMRCTHQGTELQVFGDKLQCPAHGSEFSNRGQVQNGPADTNLRSFPVSVNNNQITISLK